MKLAGKEERVINFLIDNTLIFLITSTISGLVALFLDSVSSSDQHIVILVYFIVHFAYYMMFEFKNGKTPGKIITKTCVVRKDNTKIKLLDSFLRTLIRISGLDGNSYIFGTELGMHDTLTNTKVIKDILKESPAYNSK